jgi:hypothetical protein
MKSSMIETDCRLTVKEFVPGGGIPVDRVDDILYIPSHQLNFRPLKIGQEPALTLHANVVSVNWHGSTRQTHSGGVSKRLKKAYGETEAQAACDQPGLVQGLRDLRELLPQEGSGTG